MKKFDWANIDWSEIATNTVDTLIMLSLSTLFTMLIGLILGIILFTTAKGQMMEKPSLYSVLSIIVNVLRSIPFIILMILVMPLTKAIMGTTLGVPGSIPPLVIAAAPFFARLVETSLREVDRGVIEAAQAHGASHSQIIWRVLLPEAKSGLIAGVTITAVTLVSYTAMSGIIGGGGLGDLAIRYGYQRFQTDIMIVTVLVLLALVQIIQMLGDRLVRRYQRK